MQTYSWTPRKIYSFRKKYRISQKTLGSSLGISQYTIAAWEAGRRKPTTMAKILISRIQDDYKQYRGF
jgi:DNA-binding transcriptional regulator YiaG